MPISAKVGSFFGGSVLEPPKESRPANFTPVVFGITSSICPTAARPGLLARWHAAIVASAQDWGRAQMAGKPKSGNVTGLDTVASRQAQSGASDKTQRMADKVAKEALCWMIQNLAHLSGT